MAPPYVTPFKKWLEKLLVTRLLTFFSPCIWASADGYSRIRNFFHGTYFGRMLVDRFWAILGNDVISLNRYDSHPETAKLKPWSNPFFIASSLSILNYPTDFFEFVRDGSVKIHIADVTSLSPKSINLSNGSTIATDAMVCATGWRHTSSFQFLPVGLEADLGLPHLGPSPPALERIDAEILSTFPRLRDQPKANPKAKPLPTGTSVPEEELQPYRLHRFMAPLSTLSAHNIAFAGSLATVSTTLMAQTQGLWIAAYLSGLLPQQPSRTPEVTHETLLHSRFGRWRCSQGFGARFPDFAFDALPYLDMLLADLGVNRWRKGGFAEVVEPYGAEDYRGITQEFLDRQDQRKHKAGMV